MDIVRMGLHLCIGEIECPYRDGPHFCPVSVHERHHRTISTYLLDGCSCRHIRKICFQPCQGAFVECHLRCPCTFCDPADRVSADLNAGHERQDIRHLLERHNCPEAHHDLDEERTELARDKAQAVIQGEKARSDRPGR
ncbi:MAG: hypothetical protein NVS4B2_35280 [Chloroflexota bacterium]